MTKSKYDQMQNQDAIKFSANRYGLSEKEWDALTMEQREIHYNRQNVCEHPYVYPGIAGDKSDDRLREAYSHDPYFHTAHMIPCKRPMLSINQCDCQMCSQKIGIIRDSADDKPKVDIDKLRRRIVQRLSS
jgi:hypothetical protein